MTRIVKATTIKNVFLIAATAVAVVDIIVNKQASIASTTLNRKHLMYCICIRLYMDLLYCTVIF